MRQLTRPAPLGAVAAPGALCLWAGRAEAHASEQGFVLLLPTDVYIAAGVAVVALTLAVLAVLPARAGRALFAPAPFGRGRALRARHVSSVAVAALLAGLVWAGLTGSRDPLVNPLPLAVWTLWWIGLVSVQGVFGDHWRWTNPWTGPGAALARLTGLRAPLRYPRGLGHAPAIAGFAGFAGFLLADPAPADPARLATFVGLYWYASFLGLVLFGPAWLVRAECLTVLMRAYARVALFGRGRGRRAVGLPGWQAVRRGPVPLGLALFIVILLGTGSFDGLNETFWWMGVLGVNPLEFPGRSAVIAQTWGGLVLANLALIAGFAACLWLGERIAGSGMRLGRAFRLYAPSVLPIALGYHIAHYLTSFMVDIQYVAKAVGAGLGLGQIYVTTGFFNTPGTVKAIWLSQAGAVVAGHVIAILMAHALALRAHGDTRRAILGQAPLAVFMVLYTVFGLWLLASPRGL